VTSKVVIIICYSTVTVIRQEDKIIHIAWFAAFYKHLPVHVVYKFASVTLNDMCMNIVSYQCNQMGKSIMCTS